jgi:hypothetical protein
MPSPNTDESGTLKVCLQYGSTPFLNYFIYVWHIHFKNIQTIYHMPKYIGVAPRSLDVGDASASTLIASVD